MDFNSLARKDLQALCKLNKIPANITNVAMAEALKSLEIVEGIEDFSNRSPERNVATAAKVPRTGRRTCTRSKPIGDESQSTTTRALSDEIMEESKTPAAVRSSRKTTELVSTRRTNLKEVSTVQRVYSTRRSARLTEQYNVESIPMEQKGEKIDSLATELSKINVESVIDTETVLQESVKKALEIVSNIKEEEFNDQKAKSEEISNVLDELNAVQVDNTNNSLMIENEKVGDVKEELVDELKEKAKLDESHFVAGSLVIKNQDNNILGYAMDTENPHEQEHEAAPESGTELKEDDDQDKIVDELKEESEQLFNTLDESHFVDEVNVNMVIENEDESVENCLMDSDNHEQLKSGVEEYNTNKNVKSDVLATVESSAGDSSIVEHMTCSEVSKAETLDIDDLKEYADQTDISSIACFMSSGKNGDEIKSVEPFVHEVEPSIGEPMTISQESNAQILNNDPKNVATGMEISSIAPFTKELSIKGLDCVSDDKENIDRSGIEFEPKKVEAKNNKKETATTELNAKSLRKLSKMLKEKLQISNDTTEEIGKVTKARPALQKLEDNCLL